MKRLLIALMMMAATAHAGDLAYIENNAGGKIVFTDELCPKSIGGLRMYATDSKGNVLFGCWILPNDSESIMVRYNDSTVKMYDPGALNFTNYGNRKTNEKKL